MVQLGWLWTMCFVTTSGLLTVQSLQLHDLLSEEQVSSSEQTVFFLPMEITNRVFNSKLLNSASEEYKIMYKEVTDLLDSIYECSSDAVCPTKGFYGGVAAMTFSSGSVIANATVVFNTFTINPSVVHILFVENADNIQPQTLQLNLNYTTIDKIIEKMPEPSATTTTPKMTTTPTKITTTPMTTTTTPTTPMTTTTTPTTPMTTTTTPTPTTPMKTTTTPTTPMTTTTTPTPTTPMTTTTTPTTPMKTTTTPTTPMTTTTTPTTPMKTTTTPTTPMTTTTTPTTPMTTTTIPTTTTTATTVITSTTITVQDPTTSSLSGTNVSPDHTTFVSTTITHHGTHHSTYTGDGEQNSTQDPVVENSSTVNPHDKWTDSQGVSEGKPSDPKPSGGGSSSSSDGSRDWVPGWGIALLVLAAAILLLLIIIFVMMCVQWCKKTESIQYAEDQYYTEKKQLPQEPLPVYSPQTPMTQTPGSAPFIIEDTPKKMKTGFYAVNP